MSVYEALDVGNFYLFIFQTLGCSLANATNLAELFTVDTLLPIPSVVVSIIYNVLFALPASLSPLIYDVIQLILKRKVELVCSKIGFVTLPGPVPSYVNP